MPNTQVLAWLCSVTCVNLQNSVMLLLFVVSHHLFPKYSWSEFNADMQLQEPIDHLYR